MHHRAYAPYGYETHKHRRLHAGLAPPHIISANHMHSL